MLILGSAGWMPTSGRETACYAVREEDRLLVLDAGTGIQRLITEPALLEGVSAIDVAVSHFHLDHVVGLSYLSGVGQDIAVTVRGPGAWLYGRTSSDIIDDLVRPPYQPATLSRPGLKIRDLDEAGFSWGAHRLHVRHQPTHTAPSVAFRLDDSFAYCTDTAYDEGNADFASGCSVLFHEAWSVDAGSEPGHSSAFDAASVACLADVERLMLVHLPPTRDAGSICRAARTIFARTTLANDGEIIEFEPERR